MVKMIDPLVLFAHGM